MLAGKAGFQLGLNARALAPVAHPVEHHPEIRPARDEIAELVQEVRAPVLVDRHVRDVRQLHARLSQAVADRLGREASPVLDAPEALLFRRGEEHSVAQQAGGGVAVVGVEAEDNARVQSFCAQTER